MKTISAGEFSIIRKWFLRNARQLELSQFQYYFENGPKENIFRALSAYQNGDGGFGHAIEPDIWNPGSTPISCEFALKILYEIRYNDPGSCLMEKVFEYLDSDAGVANGRWLFSVPSNNSYPHAPWWHVDHEPGIESRYNPSASLAGLILHYAEPESAIYHKALSMAGTILDEASNESELEMHSLLCLNVLLDIVRNGRLRDQFDVETAEQNIHRQVNRLIREQAGSWENYGFRPSLYITTPENPLYMENREFVDKELDYLIDTRMADGVWPINWQWNNYPYEYAVSSNWWRSELGLKNLLFLKAFDRIEMTNC